MRVKENRVCLGRVLGEKMLPSERGSSAGPPLLLTGKPLSYRASMTELILGLSSAQLARGNMSRRGVCGG